MASESAIPFEQRDAAAIGTCLDIGRDACRVTRTTSPSRRTAQSHTEAYGEGAIVTRTPSNPAMRTKSANERACIFRITLPRYNFTVISLRPN